MYELVDGVRWPRQLFIFQIAAIRLAPKQHGKFPGRKWPFVKCVRRQIYFVNYKIVCLVK